MIRRSCLVLLMVVPGLVGAAWAQPNRLLPVEDWTYDYIIRLQRRGHLLDLHPTAPPYRRGDVLAALEKIDRAGLGRAERHWVDLLERALKPPPGQEGGLVVGGSVEGGGRLINSDRLDVVRPLGDTLNAFLYSVIPAAYVDAGPFAAALAWRQDTYYDQDPDGLDTALRLLTRSENTYAGFHSRLFSATLGRWSNHWGVPGEAAALLSSNPRSQDQLVVRIGGPRLSLTGLLAELDSVTDDGRFTGRVADDSVRVGNKRRFLAAHRFDWRPSRRLALTGMESAIYSGRNAGVSLKYLNPVHAYVFLVDNRPKNDENNGFVGGMLWAQAHRFTLHGQFMVDDFDALGQGSEPISLTLLGSLVYAAPSFDLGLTLEVVSARTYNTAQPEGKYLYLLRGLATQFNDYLHAAVFADLYLDALAPGLRLTPRLDVLAQGEQDIRRPFPVRGDGTPFLLDGTAAWTVRPALELAFQRVPWWWLRLDGGLNVVSNAGHLAGRRETRFVGLVEGGLRLSLDRAYRLSFP